MKKIDYRNRSQEELITLLNDKKAELGKLLFIKKDPSQTLVNTSSIGQVKKEIARIYTAINQ